MVGNLVEIPLFTGFYTFPGGAEVLPAVGSMGLVYLPTTLPHK